jgi:hypothetical protein
LFKCCKAAICAAAAHPTAVYRAPRIVLSIAWTVEHSHCHENTEQKQNKSQHHQSDYLTGSKIRSWQEDALICVKMRAFSAPAASRRLGPLREAPDVVYRQRLERF